MRGADDIRPCTMHYTPTVSVLPVDRNLLDDLFLQRVLTGSVNEEGRLIDELARPVVDNFARVVETYEIGALNERPRDAQWIHPESVGLDGILPACDSVSHDLMYDKS